ncbi:ATP-binding protein [Permianibacter sp. IMCC34836]|uniref:ATP-binding protein n=1 Tax=Permianibacter fluminis TaxID=2738515 RepID=UPI0015573DBA|nr:ATP-binding protein [Permianibacter fluminis]NQD38306.1 ATP-binding protein [Permianibacter fluminis]
MDVRRYPHGVVSSPATENARDLERELNWFAAILEARLQHYFDPEQLDDPLTVLPAPDLSASTSPYADFLRANPLPLADRLILLLALVPTLRPQLLDVLYSKNEASQRGFSEFGGVQGNAHGGFVPTGETALFLLAGADLAGRLAMMQRFEPDQPLALLNLVQLAPVSHGESPYSGVLTLAREALHRFTSGVERQLAFNLEFPARRVDTDLDWPDLVLPATTREQLEEIKHWIQHGDTLLNQWGMASRLRPGFTSLFHGPPGTGKTLTACLIGKHCGCEVYKIDLSLIVSKYIGETEKNLARVFDLAEHRRWILFFDEADALFGKRTKVDDAHDRYANQEVSFLLQRIEDFHGVVILASNLKANIDDAFIRRFHSVVPFPMPKPPERLRLWQEAFPVQVTLDRDVDLVKLAEKYELSGGTIMNVVRHALLMSLSRAEQRVSRDDLEEGVRRELLKEGRAL